MAVGWHAVKTSQIKANDAALVLGGGPIGLSVIQSLKAVDVKTIIVSEVAAKRKEFAKQMGATHIIDPTTTNLITEVRDLTNGTGVSVAFDAAGVQGALDEAIECIQVRGLLVNIAIWVRAGRPRPGFYHKWPQLPLIRVKEKPASFNATRMLLKEKRYQGIVTYHRGDFQEVLDAIASGKMKPEGMITKEIPLEDVVEEGFHTLIKDKVQLCFTLLLRRLFSNNRLQANQVKVLVKCEVGMQKVDSAMN